MEKLHNQILDKCSSTRDDLGDVAADISLGSAYMTMWQKFEPDSAALMAAATTTAPQSVDDSGVFNCVDPIHSVDFGSQEGSSMCVL